MMLKHKGQISLMYEVVRLSRHSDGLRAERPGFDCRKGQDYSLLHIDQTNSDVALAPYPMDIGGQVADV
jgi:hypothetical protein